MEVRALRGIVGVIALLFGARALAAGARADGAAAVVRSYVVPPRVSVPILRLVYVAE
jgi:hypothetical protein